MSTKSDKNDRNKPSLVVGIGASAGGLDACKRLLGAMPAKSGIALVIVMHLDPRHESHIAELLKAATAMNVVQAGDEQILEPDHVYVIAPDRYLEIRDGLLCSRGPRKPHADRKPVDTLFSSLAADKKQRAVAIILSGTGNNGSSGIRDIKAHGGLCIVQDPDTAEYDGMPKNAIDTGCVDHVLDPEDMPRVILDDAAQPTARRPGKAEAREAPTPGVFDRILDLLGDSYGVNFRGSYKRGTLERRTERRMGLKHVSDRQVYLEILRKDPSEVSALYRDLLIDVTAFFRDPEVWAYLENHALPDLLAKHEDRTPLKIWVPGCASGEEAYSLAIICLEQLERTARASKLQIFASDVAEDALATARRGFYPHTIEQTVSPDRLSRFFRRQGEGFQIGRDVREAVTFAVHNLLSDPPFSRLDMVSCRNVLIYLEPHAQQKALQLFQFALNPGGLLVLGASETVGRQGDIFEAVSSKARVYRATGAHRAQQHYPHQARGHGPVRGLPGAASVPPKGPKLGRAIEQIVLSRYTQACVAVTESFEIQSFFGPTQDYLVQPTGEARMDLLTWARPGLYPRLRTALLKAREDKARVHITDIRMDRDGASLFVECTVEPITPLPGESALYLVSFRDAPRPTAPEVPEAAVASEEPLVRQLEAEIKSAREELQATVEQLESTNEEYRASHEELLSLNEELQSNNEELEASKEELQSLNEEMVTINRQLEDKNAELRETNTDINNLLVSTDIPVIFLDRELRVRRFTPAATGVMRLVPSDVGRSIEHIKESFQDGHIASDARQVLDKLVPIESEVQTEHGRVYARTVLPYRTEDNRIDGVCIAFHDVTERKNAQETAEEARAYAQAIVDTVRTPLVVLGSDFCVVSANGAFYEAFRSSPAETEGTRLYDLGNRQWNIPALRMLLEEILPHDTEIKDYEVEHDFEHIGRRFMRLNARRMTRPDRPLILLSVEDVTDQKAAQRITEGRAHELVTEHQRKDEFLAMLGHELRNPLSVLIHGLDLWRTTRDDAERLEQIRGMMTRQATRMRGLLDQLLEIARLTAGKIKMAKAPVDLADAARAAVESATPLIERQGHELSVSIPPEGILRVRGDFGRLTQVMENLLTNAVKYTEQGGKIELSVEPDDDHVRIRVCDNGIGMDADLIPHIFDLFTQAPRTLARSAGGLGLGLAVVKQVVEAHGGQVHASSPGRGHGSAFVVTLPRLRERRARERINGADAGIESAQSRRILVVEDEQDAATMLVQILATQGHQVRAVHDGLAALEAAREFSPQVVLLDLGLPLMDGYEVAKRLREADGDKKLLLVALTGYQEDRSRLKQSGFDHHLIKPPDMQKLRTWLVAADNDGETRRATDGGTLG